MFAMTYQTTIVSSQTQTHQVCLDSSMPMDSEWRYSQPGSYEAEAPPPF